jgi:polysaccharide biosynthesis protein PelA
MLLVRIIYPLLIAALTLHVQAQELNRKVLVVWDKTEYQNQEYTFSLAHQKLEVIFNHYGMKFEFLDASEVFNLQKIKINEYRGVLVWLTDISVKEPEKVLNLLQRFNDQQKKIAFLGELGFQSDYKNKNVPMDKLSAFFKRFDLEYEGGYWSSVIGLQYQIKVPKADVEFERPLHKELSPVVEIYPTSKRVKSWLDLKRSGLSKKSVSAVMEHESFFWAQAGYGIFNHQLSAYSQWRINPFKLARWFWGNSIPLYPDTNSINGKRIFYSHIDGDGLINRARGNQKGLCGEVIDNEIISKYTYPITVSFIGAEIKELSQNQKRTKEMINSLTSHEWVKWATHSYTHPLSWEIKPSQFDLEAYLDKPKSYKGGPIVAYPSKGYDQLNYDHEINDSYSLIKEMISANTQKEKILFWSGNCRPTAEALKTSDKASFININGGDSRFDKRYPSYSSLWPLYREIENYIQPYSSNSNENTYTNNWTGPFYGFKDVLETFKNTESPIRIKPINVYFHFYSCEHRSSVKSLQKIYDWVGTQDIFPVFIDKYAEIIQSFEKMSISKTDNDLYKIQNGNLKQLRLESTELFVDIEKSKNVIGFSQEGSISYIHLGPGLVSEVKFSKKDKNDFYFHSGNGEIESLKYSKNSIRYKGKSLSQAHEIIIKSTKDIEVNPQIKEIVKLGNNLTKIIFNDKSVDTTLELKK